MTQFTPSSAATDSAMNSKRDSKSDSKKKLSPTLARDLAFTITAAVAFIQVCTYSNGWFLPLVTYTIAVAALFATIRRHSSNTAAKTWFHASNAVGCTGLVAALWFSGNLAVMF